MSRPPRPYRKDLSGKKSRSIYRRSILKGNWKAFEVIVKETDLLVHARRRLDQEAKLQVLQYRGHIEAYIQRYPAFASTLEPWQEKGPVPRIVQEMISAGQLAGVGPMAAVAGVIAEYVGRGLLDLSKEIMVENGGDIFLKTSAPVTMGIFAGRSPLSLQLGLRLDTRRRALAVCTSSGTVGHSLSLGQADAVCVVSEHGALADAAATAIGNRVQGAGDIQRAIAYGRSLPGLLGIVIVCGAKLGLWGDIEVAPLGRKKG